MYPIFYMYKQIEPFQLNKFILIEAYKPSVYEGNVVALLQ